MKEKRERLKEVYCVCDYKENREEETDLRGKKTIILYYMKIYH